MSAKWKASVIHEGKITSGKQSLWALYDPIFANFANQDFNLAWTPTKRQRLRKTARSATPMVTTKPGERDRLNTESTQPRGRHVDNRWKVVLDLGSAQ